MRIGYFFHGFMGDTKREGGKEVSTPDGNAAYSWAIVWDAWKRGHDVIPLHPDRDVEAYTLQGPELFESFSKDKRAAAYETLDRQRQRFGSHHRNPELDVVLIEWRWPISGRNCELNSDGSFFVPSGYSTDLLRQWQLINHYNDLKVPIILWDLDHKLTYADELRVRPSAVFETAVRPRLQHVRRTRVEPPVVAADLMQFPTLKADPQKKLVYVGSRYERDEQITRWIKPVTDEFPHTVEFWGKWEDADQLWSDIIYRGRIGMKDFRKAYGDAVACPLLAKQSYAESGFVTPRPWEAVIFGTIPIGLGTHVGIQDYCYMAPDPPAHLVEVVKRMSELNLADRHMIREEMAHKLSRCDASHFVDSIEDVVNGTPPNSRAVAAATEEGTSDGKEEDGKLHAGGQPEADEGPGRALQPEVSGSTETGKGRKRKA